MRKNIVLTVTGPDRIGIVESVTKMLLEHDSNVETSRMTRLGGDFAMIMLISVPEENLKGLEDITRNLVDQGFKVTYGTTDLRYEERYRGWITYKIELRGADHEGIIHQVANYLQKNGINIESMDTSVRHSAMSGTPFFFMEAIVKVPPEILKKNWVDGLQDLAHELNVEINASEGE